MPSPKRAPASTTDVTPLLTQLAERPQLDFELDFFTRLLQRVPDYTEALQAQASIFSSKGLLKEGLKVDQQIVQLRPTDPTAHYNLACRYALLHQPDLAIRMLRLAVELGYHDFRYMIQDRDLASIHRDPRFHELLIGHGLA